jgi:hypothetical protein
MVDSAELPWLLEPPRANTLNLQTMTTRATQQASMLRFPLHTRQTNVEPAKTCVLLSMLEVARCCKAVSAQPG